MMKRGIITLLCYIAVSLPAYAQVQVLSLKTCIEKGLKNNYSLRIVKNDEQIAVNNATRANAGYLPTVEAVAGYDATLDSRDTRTRGTSDVTRERNIVGHNVNAGINAEWTIFDGYKIQTNYQRLQELKLQSATQTRMAIEDYIAELVSEYYNYVQQRIRLRNLQYAVSLSKERLRIAQERWITGDKSRLDLQQAQVDFNADSAQSLKQLESLASSQIRLNELMAEKEMNMRIRVRDTMINVESSLSFDSLWAATLRTNAALINAAHNKKLSEIDLRNVKSRDFPYIRLNGQYGYTYDRYNSGTTRSRHNWGGNIGVTIGMKLFDGNRRREMANAQINIDNAELAQQELELALKADLADLWQAYENNLKLLALEKQNLVTAKENYYIANERFMLGDLAGIEIREAQNSLLDAEERILVAEYDTKICEISLRQLSGSIMEYIEE